MGELHNIGEKYICDKTSHNHTHKELSYLDRYESYFHSKRGIRDLQILDIGVLNGGSMMVWLEYFVNTKVIGIDIDPMRKHVLTDDVRTEIFIGNQDDKKIRNKIKEKYNHLDIVIDDASHISDLSLKSFKLYWPLLRNNGIYIIEDVSYEDSVDPGRENWPGQDLNEKGLKNSGKDFQDFILENIASMPESDVFGVHIYHQFILLIKKT